MAGHRIPGPQCQVRQWFADDVDHGTTARIATPSSGPVKAKGSGHTALSLSPRQLAIVRRETAGGHRAGYVAQDIFGKAEPQQIQIVEQKKNEEAEIVQAGSCEKAPELRPEIGTPAEPADSAPEGGNKCARVVGRA